MRSLLRCGDWMGVKDDELSPQIISSLEEELSASKSNTAYSAAETTGIIGIT
jgi:hypothetical protein